MTTIRILPPIPGSECQRCLERQYHRPARRLIERDGRREALCYDHAAQVIHDGNLFDAAMNPTGTKPPTTRE